MINSAESEVVEEIIGKISKLKENMVIDLMLRGVRLSQMKWVTRPDGKEFLQAPGYLIPAPVYHVEGDKLHITAWELKPKEVNSL